MTRKKMTRPNRAQRRSEESQRRRFKRNDDQDEGGGQGSAEDALNRMTEKLAGAIEGVRSDARDEALKAVNEFAEKIETSRSRRAPIPKRDSERSRDEGGERSEHRRPAGGESVEISTFRAVGSAIEPLYRKLENDHNRSAEERIEFRSARNPGIDKMVKQWATHVNTGNIEGRIRSYNEINDAYLEGLGVGASQRAALLEGTPNADSGFASGTGAELLPLPLAGQLIMERDRASKMRGLVTTFPMSSQTVRVPVLPTAAAATRAENASYAENTPDPDSALLAATDLGVEFSAGRNFTEDSSFNIANQLTVVAGGAIGAEEDVQIATSTGAGSDITEGLDGATIIDVAETTPTVLAYADIVALYYAVPEQYRRDAAFFCAGTTLADIMVINDTVNRPIFLSALQDARVISDTDSDQAGRLLNKRIYEIPVADDVIYFGDPKWYGLGNRQGIRVDTERNVSTGLRTWVIDERLDGRVIPTSAVGTNASWRKMVY